MQLTFSVTDRAILRSGEDIQGNRWTIQCEVSDLPPDVRPLLADRLFEDTFVCAGVLNDFGTVEPRCGVYGQPVLLQVDGTDLRDLVETIRQDQRDVEAWLAAARTDTNLTEA